MRVNVLSGIASTVFMFVGVSQLKSGGAASAFNIVLTIAISTTLISYLWIFPAVLKLRYSHGDVPRPYRVPGGNTGIWLAAGIVTFWIALASWVAVFPGTLEPIFGIDYDFVDTWGVSRGKFELLAIGTILIVVAVGLLGYLAGTGVRRADVTIPIEDAAAEPA